MGIMQMGPVPHQGRLFYVVDDGLNNTDVAVKLHEALDSLGDRLCFHRTSEEDDGVELTIAGDREIDEEVIAKVIAAYQKYHKWISKQEGLNG